MRAKWASLGFVIGCLCAGGIAVQGRPPQAKSDGFIEDLDRLKGEMAELKRQISVSDGTVRVRGRLEIVGAGGKKIAVIDEVNGDSGGLFLYEQEKLKVSLRCGKVASLSLLDADGAHRVFLVADTAAGSSSLTLSARLPTKQTGEMKLVPVVVLDAQPAGPYSGGGFIGVNAPAIGINKDTKAVTYYDSVPIIHMTNQSQWGDVPQLLIRPPANIDDYRAITRTQH